MTKTALVVGASGIVGSATAALLVEQGWTVHGLARRPSRQAGVEPGRGGSAGRARHGRGAARHRPRRRLHHDMVAAGQRGGEHPRQRGHGAQSSRRPR